MPRGATRPTRRAAAAAEEGVGVAGQRLEPGEGGGVDPPVPPTRCLLVGESVEALVPGPLVDPACGGRPSPPAGRRGMRCPGGRSTRAARTKRNRRSSSAGGNGRCASSDNGGQEAVVGHAQRRARTVRAGAPSRGRRRPARDHGVRVVVRAAAHSLADGHAHEQEEGPRGRERAEGVEHQGAEAHAHEARRRRRGRWRRPWRARFATASDRRTRGRRSAGAGRRCRPGRRAGGRSSPTPRGGPRRRSGWPSPTPCRARSRRAGPPAGPTTRRAPRCGCWCARRPESKPLVIWSPAPSRPTSTATRRQRRDRHADATGQPSRAGGEDDADHQQQAHGAAAERVEDRRARTGRRATARTGARRR